MRWTALAGVFTILPSSAGLGAETDARVKRWTSREWAACRDGAVMLGALGTIAGPPGGDQRRRLVLAACACARLSSQHAGTGERRTLAAIETAERWARGEGATLRQVSAAAAAAYAIAHAARNRDAAATAFAASSAAAHAANAAAAAAWTVGATLDDVATAADDAANAATHAAVADAASAAAWSCADAACADDAATRTARARILRECADIVRRYYPDPPAASSP